MLQTLTSRAALVTGGGLAAAAVALLAVLPDGALRPPAAPPAPLPATLAQPAARALPGALPRTAAAPDAATGLKAEAPAAAEAFADAAPRSLPAPPPAAFADGPAGAKMRAIAIEPPSAPEPDTEAFPDLTDSGVLSVAEHPVSTFSADVDTASWAVVRSSLMAGTLPPRDAVRVEEMVNYFPYAYPAPEGDAPFRADLALIETPWNPGTRLLRIGIQGALPPVADRPPLNLVLLVDTSGSMDDPAKLPLLKQALRLMLPDLRDGDEVAIVTYAGAAGVALEPVPATDRAAILAALDSLAPGGGTAGQAGLDTAYAVAARMAAEGEVSRILLATDGDFNIGPADPEALRDYIAGKRREGTYLSVLGFGRGNLDDATMQALAQSGNGTAAYIDTLEEAQKVLVDQLAGALFPLADDVKLQVEFNPAAVAEYRLIGYETRALRREDFRNDRVDAGEIGAGHQVTALYEVTPPDSPARLTEPLRYGTEAGPAGDASELGLLRLRWKAPGATDSTLAEIPIPNGVAAADPDTAFAAAIAGMGQLLRQSPRLGAWSWDEAVALAESARGDDRFGWRAAAVRLMQLAQALDTGR
jgi:Ca-activated chloride channel family protein